MLRRHLIAGLFALPLAGLATVAQSDDLEGRAAYATQLFLNDAHSALRSPSGTSQLKAIIDSMFEFDVWARYILKENGEAFSQDQRSQLRDMLPGFLANRYRSQFSLGLDQPPKVGGTRVVRRDVLVSSRFPRSGGLDLPVDWRLRDFPERGPRVIDVMVAGVSYLLTTRDDFQGVIKRAGPEGLLVYVRENSI